MGNAGAPSIQIRCPGVLADSMQAETLRPCLLCLNFAGNGVGHLDQEQGTTPEVCVFVNVGGGLLHPLNSVPLGISFLFRARWA